jgi:hypothetical protein
MYNTIVANLFSGPGVGKSTNAALVFGKLKSRGIKAELITEFAKELTWEGRNRALSHQMYVTAKQMFRQYRVIGQVEVIVMDSPILLGVLYQGADPSVHFEALVIETFRRCNNLNFLLARDAEHHPYVSEGRNQTEEEAMQKDVEIRELLVAHQIPFEIVPIQSGEQTAEDLVRRILERIEA